MVSLSCLCEDSNTQRLTAHKAQPTPRHCPCSYGVTTGWPLTYIRVHALRVVCAWCLRRCVCLTACAVIVVIGAIQYRSLGSNKFLSFFNYKCVRSCVRVSAKTEHEIISFHHFFSCRKSPRYKGLLWEGKWGRWSIIVCVSLEHLSLVVNNNCLNRVSPVPGVFSTHTSSAIQVWLPRW